MSNMLRDAAEWLEGQQKANMGETVTYTRGAGSVTVSATLGFSLLKLASDYAAAVMKTTDADFTISAADLVIDDETIEPKNGDRIFVEDGETTYRYDVCRYSPQEPEWKWADDFRLRRTIRTKFMGAV